MNKRRIKTYAFEFDGYEILGTLHLSWHTADPYHVDYRSSFSNDMPNLSLYSAKGHDELLDISPPGLHSDAFKDAVRTAYKKIPGYPFHKVD